MYHAKPRNQIADMAAAPGLLFGTGTLPVGFQGRSALAAGGYRREAKLRHGKIIDFAA